MGIVRNSNFIFGEVSDNVVRTLSDEDRVRALSLLENGIVSNDGTAVSRQGLFTRTAPQLTNYPQGKTIEDRWIHRIHFADGGSELYIIIAFTDFTVYYTGLDSPSDGIINIPNYGPFTKEDIAYRKIVMSHNGFIDVAGIVNDFIFPNGILSEVVFFTNKIDVISSKIDGPYQDTGQFEYANGDDTITHTPTVPPSEDYVFTWTWYEPTFPEDVTFYRDMLINGVLLLPPSDSTKTALSRVTGLQQFTLLSPNTITFVGTVDQNNPPAAGAVQFIFQSNLFNVSLSLRSVLLYKDRLYLAGFSRYAYGIYGSQINLYDNFVNKTDEPNESISYSIHHTPYHKIMFLVGGKSFLVFTDKGQWNLTLEPEQPITNSTFSLKLQSNHLTKDVEPLRYKDHVLYLSRENMLFDFREGGGLQSEYESIALNSKSRNNFQATLLFLWFTNSQEVALGATSLANISCFNSSTFVEGGDTVNAFSTFKLGNIDGLDSFIPKSYFYDSDTQVSYILADNNNNVSDAYIWLFYSNSEIATLDWSPGNLNFTQGSTELQLPLSSFPGTQTSLPVMAVNISTYEAITGSITTFVGSHHIIIFNEAVPSTGTYIVGSPFVFTCSTTAVCESTEVIDKYNKISRVNIGYVNSYTTTPSSSFEAIVKLSGPFFLPDSEVEYQIVPPSSYLPYNVVSVTRQCLTICQVRHIDYQVETEVF